MTLVKTPINAIDIPDHNQNLNQGWADTARSINEIESFTVMRFLSMSDLTTKLVGANAPKNGMTAYLADTGSWWGFTANAWHRIYPTERAIFMGTTVPASTLGAIGDLYFQT